MILKYTISITLSPVNENGAVLLRIRLSSTLQRRKRSPKTEPIENALQSGAIWKRCFWKTLFSSVDGENDGDVIKTTRPWVSKMADRRYHVAFRANFAGRYIEMRMRGHDHAHWGYNSVFKQIRRCSVDGRKRYENDKCRRKSFWKRSKTAPFSFENGLVWTGPRISLVFCFINSHVCCENIYQ